MSVLISSQTNHNRPIIISRPEEKLDPDALGDQLAELARRRRITTRDEMLLEHLLAVGVLTLDQIRRLLWPEAAPKTAADRLSKLWQWHLLRRARQPWPERTTLPGIAAAPVFALGQGGWWWLAETEPDDYAYHLIDAGWVWRQLIEAEFYTRLAASGAAFDWQPRWRGLPDPFLPADPAAVVTLHRTEGQPLTLALELGIIDLFVPERRIPAYDDLAWSGPPLLVALVLRSSKDVSQAVADIRQRRRQPVSWLVTSWEQLTAAPALLTAPIWQRLDWQTAPRQVSLAETLDG